MFKVSKMRKNSRRLLLEPLELRAVLTCGVEEMTSNLVQLEQEAASAKALSAAITDDRFEENDTRATATNLGAASGSQTFADLALADSADWYQFTLGARGATGNSAVINFTHAQGDLDFELYSSTGSRLAQSQSTSNRETLSLSGRAAGTYYLRVYGYRNATNPSYSLTLTGPGTAPAPTDDTFENNDTQATASNLGTLTAVRTVSNLVLRDADWFTFTQSGVGEAGDYVRVDFLHSQGDIDIQLVSSSGASIATANGTGNREEISLAGLAAGTYSVRIYGYNGAINPSYSLQIDPGTGSVTPPPNPTPTGAFDIQIQYVGLSSSQQLIFEQAAVRWEQVIVGDLPSATYNGVVVDDLLINASSVSIDGRGGVLGQAGPDRFRSGSRLPYHGSMQFDTADLASMESNGSLLSVVLHEMGHILGIGTLWSSLGLLTGAGTSNPRFTGPLATAEYNALFGVNESGVPVESDGGSGTRDAHWDDTLFGSELMTGYVGPGTSLPLSRMTIASLADLGYSVNYAAADPYTPPGRTGNVATSGGSTGGSQGVRAAARNIVQQATAARNASVQLIDAFFDRLGGDRFAW